MVDALTAPLHPDLASLSFLLGTWSGEGRGDYPTIEPFTYTETVTYAHAGKPFIVYTQQTRDERGPLHTETGYLRVSPDGVELVLAQPTGIAEIATGQVHGTSVELESAWVGRTPSAKRVDRVRRVVRVDGARLFNELHMEAVGQPFGWHLEAELIRQD